MKKRWIWLIAIMVLFPTFALAAQFRAADKTVTLGTEETARNLYTASEEIVVDGNVTDDLVAAGKKITLNGNVENSVLLAGEELDLAGNIGNNARIAGQTVNVTTKIGGDLVAGGDAINIQSGSVVDGDLLAAGSSIDLAGIVSGNAKLAAQSITISGRIDGDVDIKGVTDLTVTSSAVIDGKLNYSSPNEANIDTAATIVGGTKYTDTTSSTQTNWRDKISPSLWLSKLLGLFIFILILNYLLPKTAKQLIEENSRKDFLNNFGRGFAAMIVIPFIVIGLFALLVTAGIGVAVLLFYAAALIVTSAVMGLNIGTVIEKYLYKGTEKITWRIALFGALSVIILGNIPVVGPLTIFFVYIASFGSMTKLFLANISQNQK